MHVVDISHPNFEEQVQVVNQTLSEIDDSPKPMLLVFNKVDAFSYVKKEEEEDDLTPKVRENFSLEDWKQTWMAKDEYECIFISAKEKENIDELKNKLYGMVKEIHAARFPYNDYLFQDYSHLEE